MEKAQMNTTAAQMKGKRWSCCTCLYVLIFLITHPYKQAS